MQCGGNPRSSWIGRSRQLQGHCVYGRELVDQNVDQVRVRFQSPAQFLVCAQVKDQMLQKRAHIDNAARARQALCHTSSQIYSPHGNRS